MNRAVLLAAWLGLAALGAGEPTVNVDPADLMKRDDLLGRAVVVDDRVRFFQYHKGSDYDEISLKRTLVVFRLPPRLRYERAPDALAVRVQGVMRDEGGLRVCDVNAIELLPSDLDRLNRGVAALVPNDSESRAAWARWSESRGQAFDDQALLKRARELEGEAIRIEAARPSTRPAENWLALAQRARSHQVPEPEPSALAHQAFRVKLAEAKTEEDLKALRDQVVAFFPHAPKPSLADVNLFPWDGPDAHDPGAAYRRAPEEARAALDHRLWGDVTQAILERQAAADHSRSIELADQSAEQLPERPQVAATLLEKGLEGAARQIGTLRRRDVEALAGLYRKRLNQPGRAQALVRSWLDEQRNHRLSATDAEGRVVLAQQYETMLDPPDAPTAIALLQEAWEIDPQSKEIADAFLRRRHRKVGDRWVAPSRPAAAEGEDGDGAPRPAGSGNSMLRLSPGEVRDKMGGKPDRIVWQFSQGQSIEQWIYRLAKQDRYVNLLHTPGESVPRVVADYTLPKIAPSSPPSR